jgi:hypothetical protein
VKGLGCLIGWLFLYYFFEDRRQAKERVKDFDVFFPHLTFRLVPIGQVIAILGVTLALQITIIGGFLDLPVGFSPVKFRTCRIVFQRDHWNSFTGKNLLMGGPIIGIKKSKIQAGLPGFFHRQ